MDQSSSIEFGLPYSDKIKMLSVIFRCATGELQTSRKIRFLIMAIQIHPKQNFECLYYISILDLVLSFIDKM